MNKNKTKCFKAKELKDIHIFCFGYILWKMETFLSWEIQSNFHHSLELRHRKARIH